MSELIWDREFALEQAGQDEELLAELLQLFNDTSALYIVSTKHITISFAASRWSPFAFDKIWARRMAEPVLILPRYPSP